RCPHHGDAHPRTAIARPETRRRDAVHRRRRRHRRGARAAIKNIAEGAHPAGASGTFRLNFKLSRFSESSMQTSLRRTTLAVLLAAALATPAAFAQKRDNVLFDAATAEQP